jgi:hypothetical protein
VIVALVAAQGAFANELHDGRGIAALAPTNEAPLRRLGPNQSGEQPGSHRISSSRWIRTEFQSEERLIVGKVEQSSDPMVIRTLVVPLARH